MSKKDEDLERQLLEMEEQWKQDRKNQASSASLSGADEVASDKEYLLQEMERDWQERVGKKTVEISNAESDEEQKARRHKALLARIEEFGSKNNSKSPTRL